MTPQSLLRWRIARVVWVVLVALALGKFIWSEVIFAQAPVQVCTASVPECHGNQQPTVVDAASLAADGISLQTWAIFNTAYRNLEMLIFFAAGILIFARKGYSQAAYITSLFLILFGLNDNFGGSLTDQYPQFEIVFNLISYPAWVLLPLFFFSFPSGRIVPRGLWLFEFAWCFIFLNSILFPDLNRISPTFELISSIIWISMYVAGAASQVYRYLRVSTAEERIQTRWVVAGIATLVFLIVSILILPPFKPLMDNNAPYSLAQMLLLGGVNFSFSIIPITIGIAILRHHLFDIDTFIRRTLAYAIVTAILAMVFYSSVLLLQRLAARVVGGESPVVIVLSTLFIWVLFNPLRRRVQALIDRRFYRGKYNAEKTLREFSAAARDETDLDALSVELVRVVRETIQPEKVSLWLEPVRKTNAKEMP